ncbi:MAG: YafY family transcriptional regulator [Ferrovibrio sp.]|uniref:helix-turn-helix transcriptional regulator n=1 Tax=Ferrovibrio sp. TaxID=1917215 RepID=UPI0026123989|nr:YafY family protein [Ferrovibrio sp.]MCW0236666.1 YafY family transcriptional regulator [Ferrovibrio sp.]
MSRAERLLALIQCLRRHRQPVSGQALAGELGVSLRTLYRDIASLQGQGASIDGEPGVGYVLRPGFMLPPLMFSEEELEALLLGSRWVAERADARLGAAARNAMARIGAVLPVDLRDALDSESLFIAGAPPIAAGDAELATIRQLIRSEHKMQIAYRDEAERESTRIVWPFALAFFESVRMLVAWCELRQAFRHFRTDRIVTLTPIAQRYPRRRAALMKAWREEEAIRRAQCDSEAAAAVAAVPDNGLPDNGRPGKDDAAA